MTILSQSHSQERTLNEWLYYLENLHTSEIDLGLTRIGNVAKKLNIHFDCSTVITVAGTNGKGTTCAFLENAFINEGKSVAVYSSPHIECFNERLRINKLDVTDQPLIDAFKKIEHARADVSLTYYEYTTLAAFIILQALQPDIIILEVGLGGRLDATNLIDADVAIITTIDLDHQAYLGDTRELIGFEKAGIMRANKIAIVGDENPPVSVIKHANNISAKLVCRDIDFHIVQQAPTWSWKNAQIELNNLQAAHIPQANIATALAVLDKLEVNLTSEKVNQLITQTKVPGRTESFKLLNGTEVILDVGHNPQAARYLAKILATKSFSKLYAVVGMMADKDITNSLAPLAELVEHWYFGTLPGNRAATANNIALKLPDNISKVNCFDNVTQAYKMAIENAEATDLILVFGSFFTVSEIRRLLR